MLRLAGACSDQVEIFRKQWPRGTAVTPEAGEVALSLGLDIGWAADNLLSGEALAEYERATDAAWPVYDHATAVAWAEYRRADSAACVEYKRAIATAFVAAWSMEG